MKTQGRFEPAAKDSKMRPHEKLDVWKKAIEFVVAIYKATENFPSDERFGLTSQLRRAAVNPCKYC